MYDFQIHTKKYSKLSLHKKDNQKTKNKNLPQRLKNIFFTNSNGLEISSQYGNYQNFQYLKKNILDENSKSKQITYSNNNNNLSFPINNTSSNKNINFKNRDGSLNNQKNNIFQKKFDKHNNNSKKEDSINNYKSKENANNNNNIFNNMNGIMLNKGSIKINIIPKKSNFKYISLKENNMSLNSNKNMGKSQSKSKSKSKNKRENKSHNNKVSNNINKIIFDKYLKLYKIREKGFGKKNNRNKLNAIYKENQNNINKYSSEINNSDIHKMSTQNMLNNVQYKGLKKKNKSSNLLISNLNEPKYHISNSKSNIFSKNDSKNNTNNKVKNNNNKVEEHQNSKKYLTENHIMYLINKKKSIKKRNNKNSKEKQISLKDIKNDSNKITNTITNTNNNNSNNNLMNLFYDQKQNNESKDDKHNKLNKENIIYDYASNNLLYSKKNTISNLNMNNNDSKKNLKISTQDENNDNVYKLLNERLKTEYNENSMEVIDKMYEDENNDEMNKKSVSLSKRDSFEFLYPEIYVKDDEYYLENENDKDSNSKKEKELDETESPLKMDTDKVSNENSGVLSFDQVKDIICYYNMKSSGKQNEFLFQRNERQIYDIKYKKKYLNFFFGNNGNNNEINNNITNNNNELNDDLNYLNQNINIKYPNSSIFSVDTEYSSKMKKKNNKNLVKNI